MYKGRDMIGKSVVSYDHGEKFAKIIDLIFDQNSNQLLGFLIEEGGWFSNAQVVQLKDVQSIGLHAIIVPSKSMNFDASLVPAIDYILKINNALRDTDIMTTDGQDLGHIVDLYFDENTGMVEGYEVSGGIFADAFSGRSFVPAIETLKIGRHVAFVTPHTAKMMEEQIGGIKGAIQATSDKVQETAQATGAKIDDARRSAGTYIANAVVDPEEQKAFVIGNTVEEDVDSPNGEKLILQGQVVTPVIAAKAEYQNILGKLYQACGGSLTGKANERVSAQVQETAQATGVFLGDAKRNASNYIANVVVDSEEQKAFVIGKTVEQDVESPNGYKLILQGQVVTPAIANQAEYEKILGNLYQACGGSLSGKVSERVNERVAGLTLDQAEGKRVQQFVLTPEGSIIAAPGQIVTQQVITRAKASRQELALLSAVGLSPSEAARNHTGGALTTAGEQIKSTTQTTGKKLQERAKGLWEQAKDTATDLQGKSAQKIETQRIKGALGRPVTRVILDQNDNVILNVGELITHQAVKQSRSADVLDILLSSVYNEKPELSLEDLRAPTPGAASL